MLEVRGGISSKRMMSLASLKGGQNVSNYAETSERFLSPFAKNKYGVINLCFSWITCL